jgi:para-aminobenzoate synthetase component I
MKEVSNTIKMMNLFGKENIPFFFIIDFEMKEPRVCELDKVDNKNILYFVNGITNGSISNFKNENVTLEKSPVDFKIYEKAFNAVLKNINAGNSYLLNLTFPTKIKTNLTLREIFYRSEAKYKLLFEDRFVVFSPETFIKIYNGKIYSFPMKGTIDAGIDNARSVILSDEKEKAEHITIVDLIRNDLSIVADDVEVDEFRYVETVKTNEKELLQVSSKISGLLPNNYKENIGELIFKLLPAGSISGAPKEKTVEIIKTVENYSRGYYTGVFGIYDGNDLDCAVMIRFIEQIGNDCYFKSGGGITAMSDPKKEYKELIDKVYVPIV